MVSVAGLGPNQPRFRRWRGSLKWKAFLLAARAWFCFSTRDEEETSAANVNLHFNAREDAQERGNKPPEADSIDLQPHDGQFSSKGILRPKIGDDQGEKKSPSKRCGAIIGVEDGQPTNKSQKDPKDDISPHIRDDADGKFGLSQSRGAQGQRNPTVMHAKPKIIPKVKKKKNSLLLCLTIGAPFHPGEVFNGLDGVVVGMNSPPHATVGNSDFCGQGMTASDGDIGVDQKQDKDNSDRACSEPQNRTENGEQGSTKKPKPMVRNALVNNPDEVTDSQKDERAGPDVAEDSEESDVDKEDGDNSKDQEQGLEEDDSVEFEDQDQARDASANESESPIEVRYARARGKVANDQGNDRSRYSNEVSNHDSEQHAEDHDAYDEDIVDSFKENRGELHIIASEIDNRDIGGSCHQTPRYDGVDKSASYGDKDACMEEYSNIQNRHKCDGLTNGTVSGSQIVADKYPCSKKNNESEGPSTDEQDEHADQDLVHACGAEVDSKDNNNDPEDDAEGTSNFLPFTHLGGRSGNQVHEKQIQVHFMMKPCFGKKMKTKMLMLLVINATLDPG